MKFIELQEAFELETNTLEDGLNKIPSADIEYWLNNGLNKYIKTRYSGINFKQQGFEQTQKRIDDLRTLIISLTYTKNTMVYTPYIIVAGSYSAYTSDRQIITTLTEEAILTVNPKLYVINLPTDYITLLGTTAGIQPANGIINNCWEKENNEYVIKYTDVIEGKVDTIDKILQNSLSSHRLHYTQAKPIMLTSGNNLRLYTDGNYRVTEFTIFYLKQPDKIDLHTAPFTEYTDMPEHTHMEIVKVAVQMYLENKKDPRYQTFTNEVNTME